MRRDVAAHTRSAASASQGRLESILISLLLVAQVAWVASCEGDADPPHEPLVLNHQDMAPNDPRAWVGKDRWNLDDTWRGQGGWNLEDTDLLPFPPGAIIQPADRLPPELLGRWIDRIRERPRPRYLLALPTEMIVVENDPRLLTQSFGTRDVYSVKGRAGQRFAVRRRSDESADGTLEVVDGRLESTFVRDYGQVKRLLERWERVTEPGRTAPWIDRAEWALDRVLTPEVLESAAESLRLTNWPYQPVHIGQGYALRYGPSLALIVEYQTTYWTEGRDRYWVSLIDSQGRVSVDDQGRFKDGAAHPPWQPWDDFGVFPLLMDWVKRRIVPLLPGPE